MPGNRITFNDDQIYVNFSGISFVKDQVLIVDIEFEDFSGGPNIINGSAEPDELLGTDTADSINLGDGNDTTTPGRGDDSVDGGSGADTVVLSGKLADYHVSKSGSTFTVTDKRSGSPDGKDTLTNVENLQFSDQTIEIDADGQFVGALKTLFDSNSDTAKGLSAAYAVLLGGVPNQAGFQFLVGAAVGTNFGAGAGVSFNAENIFINLFNNLVQGNADANSGFAAIASGNTLESKVGSIYRSLIPTEEQTDAGLSFFIRAEALTFYESVAAERGVAGTDGAAIVAMASLMKIAVDGNIGIGNAINDLFNAISAQSAVVPLKSDQLVDLEFADGGQFDSDDTASNEAYRSSISDASGDLDASVPLVADSYQPVSDFIL
ncbi:MAG: hypothetical protein COA37_16785 [Hoeflea sp.]|nr:MAG: hypothetical protein COA37_16785 [Hoeflea sp.]